MPEFICNRNVVITAKGHCVVIRKGQPSYVPIELAQEAIALGAEPVEGAKEDFLPGEDAPEERLNEVDREAMVFAAFDQIISTNARSDFGADGKPTVAAVKDVAKVTLTKKELLAAFQKYRESKAEE